MSKSMIVLLEQDVVTYIGVKNKNGNRKMVIVNEDTKEFVVYGFYHNPIGTEFKVASVGAVVKQLVIRGYQKRTGGIAKQCEITE